MKICEIFCGKSLKEDLSIDTTFDPCYFSWDSPFKLIIIFLCCHLCKYVRLWFSITFCPRNSGAGVVRRLEWRCRGCFSISETRETLIAELDLSNVGAGITASTTTKKTKTAKPEIFIHPHRFQLLAPEEEEEEMAPIERAKEKAVAPTKADPAATANRRGGGHLSLQIRPTDTQDSGRYFCLVNGEKRPWRLYAVAVQDVPSTPGKPLIMAFNSTAVNLSWTPPLQHHHAAVTHYLIQEWSVV